MVKGLVACVCVCVCACVRACVCVLGLKQIGYFSTQIFFCGKYQILDYSMYSTYSCHIFPNVQNRNQITEYSPNS